MSDTELNSQRDQRSLRVASVQFESSPGDKDSNFRKIEAFVEQASAKGVRLIVFPECCISGYWFIRNLSVNQLAALAEPIPHGPSTRRLRELSWSSGLTIGAGLVEAGPNGDFYNSYVVAMPDGSFQRHRKMHAFEHLSIKSGSEYTVFDIPDGLRVGLLICYDCNIFENGRLTALRGAIWKGGDDMVIADLDAGLLAESTGRKWIRARRPELYGPLAVPTGLECDTRKLKFEE